MQAIAEPAKPSQDFFGLIVGAIGCLPNNTPTAYPPVSEATVTAKKVIARHGPSSGSVSSTANPASSGTYAITKTPAEVSRTNPAEPFGIRQKIVASTVSAKALTSARGPSRYAATSIATVPARIGTRSTRVPPVLSAFATSSTAIRIAASTRIRNSHFRVNNETM